MRSQCLCNITYTAALLTHSLYGLPVLIMQTLILSFRHVPCSFPSSFAFYGKKNKRVRVFTLCTLFFSAVSYKKENRQRLYNLLSIFILKLIFFSFSVLYPLRQQFPFFPCSTFSSHKYNTGSEGSALRSMRQDPPNIHLQNLFFLQQT